MKDTALTAQSPGATDRGTLRQHTSDIINRIQGDKKLETKNIKQEFKCGEIYKHNLLYSQTSALSDLLRLNPVWQEFGRKVLYHWISMIIGAAAVIDFT